MGQDLRDCGAPMPDCPYRLTRHQGARGRARRVIAGILDALRRQRGGRTITSPSKGLRACTGATWRTARHIDILLADLVRQRTAVLEQVMARERAILAGAASAIIATDLAGRITMFNPAAEAAFRLAAPQALGRPVLELCDPEELRTHAADLPPEMRHTLLPGATARTAAQDNLQRNEWSCVRADGTRFPGLSSLSVLRDGQGGATGFLFVIVDLSEHRAMEEALRQRTLQAEAATRAKSTFLAAMSHELRTPLNAVIGFSSLLQRMPLPQKALEFVSHINRSGQQLLALIDDILDISWLDAAQARRENVPFELEPLLDAARETAHPWAAAKGLSCELVCSLPGPTMLTGDPRRLRQLLLKLLDNAVKFTSTGGVRLTVHETHREPGRVTLRIDVADTGIGIPLEAQARIFEPFAQGDSALTRRFGGAGLGLSIVQRLVAMMQGRLDLSSTPGRGTTFSVTLTLDTGDKGR
jgi:PAS domain S-box-containing protein